jgi:hypothetical protein
MTRVPDGEFTYPAGGEWETIKSDLLAAHEEDIWGIQVKEQRGRIIVDARVHSVKAMDEIGAFFKTRIDIEKLVLKMLVEGVFKPARSAIDDMDFDMDAYFARKSE